MWIEKAKRQPTAVVQEVTKVIYDINHFSFAGVRKDRQREDEIKPFSHVGNRQILNTARVVFKVIAIIEDEVCFRSSLLSGFDSVSGDIDTPIPVVRNGGMGMMQNVPNVSSKIEDVFSSPWRVAQLPIEINKLSVVLRDKRHFVLAIKSFVAFSANQSNQPSILTRRIYLPRSVAGCVAFPNQSLASSPDLIQFLVIPFVQNISDSLLQIVF
jgi:hypothetical protein